MEYPNEEQLNKLIRAYNDEQEVPGCEDDMTRSTLQIDEFEQKLNKIKTGTTQTSTVKTKKMQRERITSAAIQNIHIPELPSHMTREIKETKEEMFKAEIQKIDFETDKILADRKSSEEEIEEISEERIEESVESLPVYLTDDELVNKKLRELVKKKRELSMALQKEQASNSQYKEQARLANERTEKYKKIAELAKNNSHLKTLEDEKTKNASLLEQKASLELRTNAAEKELGRLYKVLKREVGENVDLKQIEKDDGSWKGRSQQIEVLKSKLKYLQKKLNGKSTNSPRDEEKRSLVSNSERTQELFGLRKEVKEMVC